MGRTLDLPEPLSPMVTILLMKLYGCAMVGSDGGALGGSSHESAYTMTSSWYRETITGQCSRPGMARYLTSEDTYCLVVRDAVRPGSRGGLTSH